MTDTADDSTRRLNPPDPAAHGMPVPPSAVGQTPADTRERAADRPGRTILGWSATAAAVFTSVVILFALMVAVIMVFSGHR
jgi:hypothetical protein